MSSILVLSKVSLTTLVPEFTHQGVHWLDHLEPARGPTPDREDGHLVCGHTRLQDDHYGSASKLNVGEETGPEFEPGCVRKVS